MEVSHVEHGRRIGVDGLRSHVGQLAEVDILRDSNSQYLHAVVLSLGGVRFEEVSVAGRRTISDDNGDVVYVLSVSVGRDEHFLVHLEEAPGRVRISVVVANTSDMVQHLGRTNNHYDNSSIEILTREVQLMIFDYKTLEQYIICVGNHQFRVTIVIIIVNPWVHKRIHPPPYFFSSVSCPELSLGGRQ